MDFFNFSHTVRHQRRYLHSDDVASFLDALVASSSMRHRLVTKRGAVWRAQVGCQFRDCDDGENQWQESEPFPPKRMKPLSDSAYEGRVNPKGIPCLYVATDRETAMAEVRPWIGSTLLLGQFQLVKDLRLIDFSVGHDSQLQPLFDESTPEELEENIWAQVDRAFSEPVEPTHSSAEYVPTQIIAELFRNKGFDGVVYKSKLGPGLNFGLFDLGAAELRTCSLVSVKSVSFSFGELEKTYAAEN
ncbi:RES family NAD+ phosphorylase [Methylomonas sp. MS20]|uniref:RES family NAD+ phosphorylase n=1 Tax=unclassified Methylomonas TaxID=2608980 RepID=UPI0028A35698|nr:RES family NAD+ phosphorylase [Methylomonas sp. MV1]MDT4331908.1 RES family NAD+ phosphorylase [Methylomonas sp. MV1]